MTTAVAVEKGKIVRFGSWFPMWFQEIVLTMFGFRKYGENKLLTRGVKSEFTVFGVAFILYFAVEMWAQTKNWSYALPDSGFAFVNAFAFALMILLLDRSIVMLDLKTKWALAGRVVLLLGFSFINAIAVELGVFETTIDRRIEQKEKLAIAQIRADGEAKENEKFSLRMAETSSVAATENRRNSALLADDTAIYRAKREKERAELVVVQESRRKNFMAIFVHTMKETQAEAAGRPGEGRTGKPGMKAAYEASKLQENAARDSVDGYLKAAGAELVAFDAATEDGLAKIRAERKTGMDATDAMMRQELDKIRKEQDAKIQEVKDLAETNPDLLAARYGGDWKQSRGFLDRFFILCELSSESWIVWAMVWGCRIFMILFGMSILLLKLMASPEFKRYLSLQAQATVGNEDATEHFRSLGYDVDDPLVCQAIGFAPEVQIARKKLVDARRRCLQGLDSFETRLGELCQDRNENSGLPKTRVEMDVVSRVLWRDHAEDVCRALYEAENELWTFQKSLPAWRQEDADRVPRTKTNPWTRTGEELAALGWEDPTERMSAATEAEKHLALAVDKLWKFWRDFERELELASRDLEADLQKLEDRRYECFEEEIASVLRRCDKYIATMKQGGIDISAIWPSQLPRLDELWVMWQVKPRGGSTDEPIFESERPMEGAPPAMSEANGVKGFSFAIPAADDPVWTDKN